MSGNSHQIATGLGLVAILLWSSLATVTTTVARIPPFQLVAMSFALSALVGLAWAAVTQERLEALRRIPTGYWLLGVYGLFGYHAAYFYALRYAPPVGANLVNYLWPLLIVVFSAMLPLHLGGRPLRWWHIAGTLLGLIGTVLLVLGATVPSVSSVYTSGAASIGYAAAFAAAVIWSTYSVGSRFFSDVPSLAVMGTSALTAVLAALTSWLVESWVWPASLTEWLAILFQGIGPVGLAFYLWDRAMKHGHLRFVGIVSYATPLFSTLLLVASGRAEATSTIWFAAVLVTAGAALGAADVWFKASDKTTN